jgi:hypothetical protein
MPVRYRDLPSGHTKRLSEIVFAGSHDASITSGSSYAKTQRLDIAGQADAGVRLFDLRIMAQRTGQGTNKSANLRGYHGSPGGEKTITGTSTTTQKTYNLETAKKIKGEWGLPLIGMLQQAKTFVQNTKEFLIFKFDKCTNYEFIADLCTEILDDNIYTPIGKEFSQLTLNELKRKVVCVFNEAERQQLLAGREAEGVLGFKSLKQAGSYDHNYSGLQYCGKGGTKPKNIHKNDKAKMIENRDKQKELMLAMARQADDNAASVLGMMYWTSTGTLTSIKDRNKVMWGASGVRRMEEIWNAGLDKAVETQLQRDEFCYGTQGGIRRMKAYFPNIIMIDFADPGKCQTIYDLNTAADQKLVAAYKQAAGEND